MQFMEATEIIYITCNNSVVAKAEILKDDIRK